MAGKILIADDHEIFRKGIRHILSSVSADLVIDEAANGQEVMVKIWSDHYEAVLLDISMPGRNGIDVLKEIKSVKADQQVLMLSMYPEEQFAVRSLKAGAAGYLTKACGPEELSEAIAKVRKGKKYISPSLAEKLACHIEADSGAAPHEKLSDREYEVMCMSASGKSVKQIAFELSLSDKTISTYRARILQKMNMTSIAQLIRYAVDHNLVNQPEC